MARTGRRQSPRARFALRAVPAVVALACVGMQSPAQALDLARFDAADGGRWVPSWTASGVQWRPADRAILDARNVQLSFAAALAALNPTAAGMGLDRLNTSRWGYGISRAPSDDAMTLTWFGGTGDWTVAANWSPAGGPPGADDTATINAGNAQLGVDTAVAGLVMGGGQLSGSGKLTVSGASQWTGGAHNGVGISQFDGSLTISGANDKNLGAGRVLNVGDTTWSGNTAANNNRVRFTGATINSNGTWTDSNAFDAYTYSYSGTNAFNNIGTYDKQGNTTTTMNVAYNNTGTTNVNAGRFTLTGGSTSASAFNVAAGAVLDLNYGTHNLNAASITGAGTTEISGSGSYNFVNLNGGTMGTALLLSGGNLQGADHTLLGPVTWTGTIIRGAASTTVANDLTISGANGKNLGSGRVLNTEGTTTWRDNTASGNNRIRFTGATINNSGTWNDINAFDTYAYDYSGTNAFNNIGTYNKQGNTTTTMGVAYNNIGTTNVGAGTLTVTSALTNHGLVQTAAGATFLGSSAAFVNAGILSGDGTIATHVNGDILNQGGAIDPGINGIGHLDITGALVNSATGRLNFELASLTSFDTLGVSDDVSLGGEIGVWNLGYTPVLGDSFVVMTFAAQADANPFDSIGVYGFAPGTEFTAIYNLHDVTLTVSAVAAVPEPQTVLMMLAGLGVLGFVARRRRA